MVRPSLFIENYLNQNMGKCNQENEMISIEDIHNDVYKFIKR